MMTYRYLVSYMTESIHGTQQIVSAIIARNKAILTSKDIQEAEEWLKKDTGVAKVGLLSFSKLEGEI